jgi:hypothetical protein
MRVCIATLPEPFRVVTCCDEWLLVSDRLPASVIAELVARDEAPDLLQHARRLLDRLDADAAEVAEAP